LTATPVWAQESAPASEPGVQPAIEPQGEPGASEQKHITLKDGLKQLKRIRLKHFGQIRNTEIRQAGIAKLQDYTESKFYPHLLEIFAREDKDVRGAVLDLLVDQKDNMADTTIAYSAVFDKDAWFRREAARRLVKRMEVVRAEAAAKVDDGTEIPLPKGAVSRAEPLPPGLDSGIPWRIKAVIANGLKQKDERITEAAATLAEQLRMYDMIPAMVNAQVQGPAGSGAGVGGGVGGDGALAYIMVGQQQAYVADLEPVVGDSAVGFDPQLGVVTSGTVLAIGDASVVTYRTEIHYSLRRLANAGWDGRTTDGLGFDQRKWREWFTEEFLPYRKAVAEGQVPENHDGPG
jgi:hypothetical protein